MANTWHPISATADSELLLLEFDTGTAGTKLLRAPYPAALFTRGLAAANRWLHFPYDLIGHLSVITAPNRRRVVVYP